MPGKEEHRIEVHIDIDQLADMAHIGVRRAVLFMGMGLNAMQIEEFRDYQLSKLKPADGQDSIPIEFFPESIPDSRISEIKEEFSLWIISCSMREILEHYSMLLDRMHNHCLTVQQAKGLLKSRNPENEQKAFHRNGSMKEKLKLLRERFDIHFEDSEIVDNLYTARNCLTHQLGIVIERHLNEKDGFCISWPAFNYVAVGIESGVELKLADLMRSGMPTQEPTRVEVRAERRVRKFPLHSKLNFSRQDLWELCYFFNAVAIPRAVSSFLEYLKRHDVEMKKA